MLDSVKRRKAMAGVLFGVAVMAAPTALAGDVDEELRDAARRHRGGDTRAAVVIWERWAAKGDVDSAYNLGVVHQHGDGVARDPVAALKWYRKAAAAGDRVSQFMVGLAYQNGDGVAADEKLAHEWFTKHRQEHLHHDHHPQMQAWRRQALALIEARDRHEAMLAARESDAATIAELRRRAGMEAPRVVAALPAR